MVFWGTFYTEGDGVSFCPRCWEADGKANHLPVEPFLSAAGPRYDYSSAIQAFIHPRTTEVVTT